MNNNNNQKKISPLSKQNILEILKDASKDSLGTIGTISNELIKPTSDEFIREILGRPPKNYRGELVRGKLAEMKDIFSGKKEEQENFQNQLRLERRLIEEEKIYVERRINNLRLQIQQIHEEIVKLAQVTPKLSQEVEIASFQAPISASTYELTFLKHILKIIRDFRIKIEKASTWLSVVNARNQKKNAWGISYKKYGAKYLLSGEHYLARSAG